MGVDGRGTTADARVGLGGGVRVVGAGVGVALGAGSAAEGAGAGAAAAPPAELDCPVAATAGLADGRLEGTPVTEIDERV